jgi:hypothetical protein
MTIEVARNELLFYGNINHITSIDGFVLRAGIRT